MMRLISEDGTLIDPTPLNLETLEQKIEDTDARRSAPMRFLSDLGLRLDDRLLCDEVQATIDRALFAEVEKHAA